MVDYVLLCAVWPTLLGAAVGVEDIGRSGCF